MSFAQRCLGVVVSLLLAVIAMLPAQGAARPIKFTKVWTRGSASAKDIRMATSPADLLIDTIARRLEVKNKHAVQGGAYIASRPLSISLDHVKRLTFDVSSHAKRDKGTDYGLGLIGDIAGAVDAAGNVTEYWCVIEYVDDTGASHRYLLAIDKDRVSEVLALLKRLVPSSVEEARFTEQQHEMADGEMTFNDEYDVTVVKENRPPIPAAHPDSALIVVAAPTVNVGDAGHGTQFRLYANHHIVAVNKQGTYTFFSLPPGAHALLAKAGNTSVLDITVEAGKEYYFFENTFLGAFKDNVRLTRQAAPLVQHEITGMFFSDWRLKAR